MRVSVLAGVATLTLAAALPVGAAPAGATPPAGRVGIEVLNINGTGCKQGTAQVAVSLDGEAFTTVYSTYLAQTGGKAREAHKVCRLNLRINALAGFSAAISHVDHRGFAALAAGATAEQQASYRFHGSPTVGPVRHTFTGPYTDDWQATDTTPAGALIHGPCGKARNLDVDTELTVSAGASQPGAVSYIAMDSTDGVAVTTYHLSWRRCT